jgi:hypothetical protein
MNMSSTLNLVVVIEIVIIKLIQHRKFVKQT